MNFDRVALDHAWKHRFTSECMNLLHDQAFGARMPTYATVLQLDRKMRAFPVPPILQVVGFGSTESRPGGYPESIMLTLQRHIVLAIREAGEYASSQCPFNNQVNHALQTSCTSIEVSLHGQ